MLARWQPAWLRYSPLSVSGLLSLGAVAGVIYQSGFVGPLQHSRIVTSMLHDAERLGTINTVAIIGGAVLVASVLLAVLRSLLTYGNLVLLRQADVLHLRHGLLRIRERAYDMSRLRGGTLRQPLLVRMFGGARLDAVMTGVHGAGEASVLLPPCPVSTAEAVLTELVGDPEVVSGPLRGHGRRAATRRCTRALGLPVLAGAGLAVVSVLFGKSCCARVGVARLDRGDGVVCAAGGRPDRRARSPGPRWLAGDAVRQRGTSPRLPRHGRHHQLDGAPDAVPAPGQGRDVWSRPRPRASSAIR